MALLILRNTDGFEVGRRAMDAHERLDLYRAKMEGTPLRFGAVEFRLLTVAWRIPDETCVCAVAFERWAPEEKPYAC